MIQFLTTPVSWPITFAGTFMVILALWIAGAMFDGWTFYEASKGFLSVVSCGVTLGTYCSL